MIFKAYLIEQGLFEGRIVKKTKNNVEKAKEYNAAIHAALKSLTQAADAAAAIRNSDPAYSKDLNPVINKLDDIVEIIKDPKLFGSIVC